MDMQPFPHIHAALEPTDSLVVAARARDAFSFRLYYIEGEKFGFSQQSNPSNKKSMYLTSPVCGIDLAARHTRGFRRFDADSGGGECGHLRINK